MTGERAQAYGRVVATIDELAGNKLLDGEVKAIREAADLLLFSEEGDREAFGEMETLIYGLIESDRWTEERGQQLLDDLAACGQVVTSVR
jgi:hypothetical protein